MLWLLSGSVLMLILVATFVYLISRRAGPLLKPPLRYVDSVLSKWTPRSWQLFKGRFTRHEWHGLTLTLSVVLLVLTVYVFVEITDGWRSEEALYRIDQAVHQMLAESRTPGIVQAMHVITYLGDAIVAGAITAVLAVVFIVRRERWQLAALFWVMAGGQAVLWSLKWIFSRTRPAGGATTPLGSSFPSGHTFTATVLYGYLIYLAWRYLSQQGYLLMVTVVLSLAILLVALSRVLLSVHWVSDVLGGLSIGLAWLVCSLVATRALQAYYSSSRSRRA